MDCPICKKNGLEKLEEQSRGMGNQEFVKCTHCGTVALLSGDQVTQVWTDESIQEGGK